MSKIYLAYLPHGIDCKTFRPLKENTTEYNQMMDFRKQMFQGKEYDFVVLFNNRNVRRKCPGDVVLAFKFFINQLSEEERGRVCLILHTHIVDNNGTDLMALADAVAKECSIIFSPQKFDTTHMNYLYNITDVTINLSSNEGYGLSTAESLMAGTPIVANVTGGLQDQMGFVDENGEFLKHNIHFHSDWGSNHDKKYKKHGEWVNPVWPTNRSLAGSPPTPYIFDDRADWYDASNALMKFYQMSRAKRKKNGIKGREYLLNNEVQMSAEKMGENFIKFIDKTLKEWKPREKFEIYNCFSQKKLNNKNFNITLSDFQIKNFGNRLRVQKTDE